MSSSTTKIVKQIMVNIDKCIGCRACEVACSGVHANPKYSSINPARSRIRMVIDELNDVYVPVLAGYHTTDECSGRHAVTINGKNYFECSFCRSSCSTRDLFKEPDSGLPLKCDMCESVDISPLSGPMCVHACGPGALTYEDREDKREEKPPVGEMEIGLQALINKYGVQPVMDIVARISKNG